MNSRRNRRSSRRNRRSRGGVAPYPSGMTLQAYQPSENVMEWATTANANRLSPPEMRNVAHGGARGSRRRRHRRKRSTRR